MPADSENQELVEFLWKHWESVTTRSLVGALELLAPKAEKEDAGFRAHLVRLSVTGLRVIAGFCVAATFLWLIVGVVFLHESVSGYGLAALIAVFLVGLAALLISYWQPAKPSARLFGLVILAILLLLDLLGSVGVPLDPGERWAFFSGSAILMMFVAIAALPVRPLHMTTLATLFVFLYSSVVLTTGETLWDGGAASISLVFLLMTVLASTMLTAVVYHQRLLAYRARQAVQQAFEELRDAQVRINVSESSASQSRFAAALSHELNSPLGSLTSAFDTLVHAHERERAQPETREELDVIWKDAARSGRESAERLCRTIERMKRLTNLDRAEEQVTDLNQLWKDTVALLESELAHKADVELRLSAMPPVRCRPQQMGAVFSNLLRNAASAMDSRGTVRITTAQQGDDIVLEVQDEGRGMPANQVNHLFTPTFRVEGGRVSTTNWGLFISQSIVAHHGGVLEIESEPGVGTTARIVLPAATRESASELAAASSGL